MFEVMNQDLLKKVINIAAVCLPFVVALYLLLFVDEDGFDFIWLLPISFGACFFLLNKAIERGRLILFYSFFTGVAFLRYVVGPFLLCYTNDYYGKLMNVHPSTFALHTATYLMIYELIVCSFVVYFFSKRVANNYQQTSDLILPKSYLVYIVFIFVACLFIFFNSKVLLFFSFGVWGMNEIDISALSPIAQVTIMLAISGKFVLFWFLLSVIKAKYDKSNFKFIWTCLGFITTLILGFIYYGGNRAQFLFSLITSLYLFTLCFPKLKKIVFVISLVFGAIVFSFITDQRNYTDFYSYEKGTRNKVLNTSQTITAYFGGVTNVAIGVDMAGRFSYKNKAEQIFKDVLMPVVGLNKIITFENKDISNTLFNYVFYNSNQNISQILPSIAHGYFFGGLIFCVILDILQLIFVFYLIFQLRKTRRMELVFIFNIVLFRFSLMFGQNVSQQINGIAMQLVLPMCIYWLNNRFALAKSNERIFN